MDSRVSDLTNCMELTPELLSLLTRYTTLNKMLLVMEAEKLGDLFREAGDFCSFEAGPTALSDNLWLIY